MTVLNDCINALNRLLLTVLTVPTNERRIEILCSVTQLHEKVKNALHTTGLDEAQFTGFVDPGEQVGGLKFILGQITGFVVPAQYGDHVLKSPAQQNPLLHDGALLPVLHVGGLKPDG
jgi:hypothetical protein